MRTKCEARKQAIIGVAREVFQACGFSAASMSQIATRLGGSKATLYNYFNSKEDLFVEVTRQFAAERMGVLFNSLDENADIGPTLQVFGERLLSLICQPDLIAAHRNIFAESGKSEIGQLFYECGPLIGLKSTTAYLERCMALGKLRKNDPFVAAQQLIALYKAEVMDRLLFGVDRELPVEKLPAMVARAVDAFLSIHGAARVAGDTTPA